jgi:hypothetical protein
MKRTLLLIVALATTAVALASAPVAQGDENVKCTATVTGVVRGNVTVPTGATCTIIAAVIYGNVIVKPNAEVHVVNSTVYGNIEGDRFREIDVQETIMLPLPLVAPSELRGNVIGKDGGKFSVRDSDLETGNIQLENSVGEVDIRRNTVGGDIQVVKNRTGSNLIQIRRNDATDIQFYENTTVRYEIIANNQMGGRNLQVYKNTHVTSAQVSGNGGESVQCFDNAGPLFVGGPNTAEKREGQCS